VPECLDPGVLSDLLGPSPTLTICLPAGMANVPGDTISVEICPAEGAQPCGLTQTPGCPVEITSITAALDVPARTVSILFDGRVNDLPIVVSESVFNTKTTCTTDIHGADASAPFHFEAVIPLEVQEVSPGVLEIVGTGAVTIENVEMRLTVSGGLLCALFQAGQGAFVDGIVSQLGTLAGAITGPLEEAVVGLRLCE